MALALDVLKGVKGAKQTPRPVYALVGDDVFLQHAVLGALSKMVLGAIDRQDAEMATTRFSGDQANLADVLDEIRTLPFLSKNRLVIVTNADAFVAEGERRKGLEEYVGKPSSSGGVLVLVFKTLPSNTRLYKAVDAAGGLVDCKSPPERGLTGWLVEWARSHGNVVLEDEAARLLLELVGPELGLLIAEVDKLSTYVGEQARITRQDVAKMVGAGRVESIWKTLEAATSGRGTEAIEDLDRLIAAGESPVGLLAAMSASLRKVHYAGQLRLRKIDAREACKQAGITYPVAIEQTVQQHAHLGPSRVSKIPEMLLRADLDLKGGSQLAPRVVLERLLLTLSRPRKD